MSSTDTVAESHGRAAGAVWPAFPLAARHRSVLVAARVQQTIAVAVVLATAALLRLGALDVIPFKLDEVDALSRARALVDHGVLPTTGGHMSWGLPDPPLVIYLLSIPAAFTRDAALAAAFMGLLDVLAVLLTYRLGAQAFGKRVGVAAGLLYATSPWAVYFARDVWVTIVPLFTALALFAAVQVVAERRQRWAVVFFLAVGAQMQTHLLAVVFLAPVLLTIALFPRRWLSPSSMLGIGLALLVNAPFVLSGWEQRDRILATVQGQMGSLQSTSVSALELSLRAVTGLHVQDLLAGALSEEYAAFAAALGVVYVVVGVLVVIGTVRCVVATVRRTAGWEAHLLLLVWAWTPVAVMTGASATLSVHYFTMLYPALFLIAGLGLRRPTMLARSVSPRVWRAIAQPALVACAAAQAVALVGLLLLLRRVDLGGGVGLPYSVWSDLAVQVREVAARGGSRDVRVMTRGTDPAVQDYPAALAYALGPEIQPIFVQPGSMTLPGNAPAVYIHLLGDSSGDALLSQYGQPQGWLSLPGGREWARVFVVPASTPEQAAALPSRPDQIAMTHGLQFLGVDRPDAARAGEPALVTTYWRLSGIGPAERGDDLAIFHHIVDGNNRVAAQRDGVSIPSWRWRNGDVLIERSALRLPSETPAGSYQLIAGVYSRRDQHRARRLDNAAETIELGAMRVDR